MGGKHNERVFIATNLGTKNRAFDPYFPPAAPLVGAPYGEVLAMEPNAELSIPRPRTLPGLIPTTTRSFA